MFLVGLDIAGDKIIEINVFSPGALVGAVRLTGVNFMTSIIDSLERKVEYKRSYPGSDRLSNIELATYWGTTDVDQRVTRLSLIVCCRDSVALPGRQTP
jgi:hypothetical protein